MSCSTSSLCSRETYVALAHRRVLAVCRQAVEVSTDDLANVTLLNRALGTTAAILNV